ncbi:unnamed protein product, partial [Coregonus sp. 'balchen']
MPPRCQLLNMVGSFNCTCPPGIEGTGYECQNVDQCPNNSTQPQNCSSLTLSNNTDGSSVGARRGTRGTGSTVRMRYNCTCILGLVYGADTCVSEEDCLNASSVCHPLAACHPTKCSFYSHCRDSFCGGVLGRGRYCPEISYSFNTEGSYTCDCWDGYQDHRTHCMDTDECEAENFTCPDNSTCTNAESSYCCPCDMDFLASNNSLCLDIDECAVGLEQCPNTSDCQNTPGSFVFDSWDGYQGNGTGCEHSDLYPFGDQVGDKGVWLDTEDGNSPYIIPIMGFPFMGKLFDLSICKTMYITIMDSSSSSLSVRTSSSCFLSPSLVVSMATEAWPCCPCSVTMLTSPWGGEAALSVYIPKLSSIVRYEEQKDKPAFTPAWILKITWDYVMAVSYQEINHTEMWSAPSPCYASGSCTGVLARGSTMTPSQATPMEEPTFPQEVWGNIDQLGQLVYELTGPQSPNGTPRRGARSLEDLAFGPETLPPNQQDWIRVRELRGLRWGGSWGDVFLSILSKVYEELLPFQWCCIQSPLCHLYLAKTLLDRCQGYGWVSRLLHKSGQGNTGHCIFTLQRETGELETDGQVRRVPAVVRMAAFHQGIGKVSVCGAPYLGQWRCTPGGCTWRVDGGDGGQQLAALVEVPQTFYSWTVGLLGFWSSNHTDDFLQSDGKLMIFPNITFPWRSVCTPLACPCVHDILSSNDTDLGLQSLESQELDHNLVMVFVIRCKVKSTVHMQISAQDANTISFSLLFPRPPQAFVGKINDQLFSSQFTPILQVCNCLNGGTCQYDSIVGSHLQGTFQFNVFNVSMGWKNQGAGGERLRQVRGSVTGIDGAQVAEDKKPLILGLVLGIGIPFLLLLAALACICRSRKKTQG